MAGRHRRTVIVVAVAIAVVAVGAGWWLVARDADGRDAQGRDGPHLDAIVAHWDAYTASWAAGVERGVGFIAEHNMYDFGPNACAVGFDDPAYREDVRVDIESIERRDDWRAPWPERLGHDADAVYAMTLLPVDHEPIDVHLAVVDGGLRHYFDCAPPWLGAWEFAGIDGSRLWTFLDYRRADDRFVVVQLDEDAGRGPCAGGPMLGVGVLDRPGADSFVAERRAWCGPPGADVAADLVVEEREVADGDLLLIDPSSGLAFTDGGPTTDVSYTYDGDADALSDELVGPWERSDRSNPVDVDRSTVLSATGSVASDAGSRRPPSRLAP